MKDALYFSHDSNARHDPKITAMRGVYGSEGYGWFWMLVEMMRESENYKLDMKSKYAFNAYAMQLQCERNAIESFVHDCISEFDLFYADEEFFWSDSLLRRMEIKDIKSKKARESANARWNKSESNANASENNAIESKNDAYKVSKESKGKLSKEDIKPLVDKPPEYDPEFEHFWNEYPQIRRRDKAKSYDKWKVSVKTISKVELTECVKKYAKDKKAIGHDGGYAKLPVTFLNGKTYMDYVKGAKDDETSEHTERIGGKYSEYVIE